jgi:hypothetical protein
VSAPDPAVETVAELEALREPVGARLKIAGEGWRTIGLTRCDICRYD